MMTIPFGHREDEGLEFKARAALEDLRAVAREVVGMLNRPRSAAAGQLWIGVGEQDGVASAVEPVAPGEWDRLWNHLVDTIEPSPTEVEVSHEMVPLSGDGAVLCLRVRSSTRGPFAQLRQGGRFYWKRVGPRLRAMTRDEIFAPPSTSEPGVQERLSKEVGRRLKNGRPGLWLRVEADGVRLRTGRGEVARVLQDPELTGNRESGWHAIDPYRSPVVRQGKVSQGVEGGEPRIDVHQSGGIVLEVPLESLHWKGPEKEIWPFALIEYVVSTLRIAATLYKEGLHKEGSPTETGAHLALVGLHGWALTPGSPVRVGGLFRSRRATYELDDLVLDRALVFHAGELEDNPVRAASRLIVPVYESFGFRETDIPSELDTRSGRLTFPV